VELFYFYFCICLWLYTWCQLDALLSIWCQLSDLPLLAVQSALYNQAVLFSRHACGKLHFTTKLCCSAGMHVAVRALAAAIFQRQQQQAGAFILRRGGRGGGVSTASGPQPEVSCRQQVMDFSSRWHGMKCWWCLAGGVWGKRWWCQQQTALGLQLSPTGRTALWLPVCPANPQAPSLEASACVGLASKQQLPVDYGIRTCPAHLPQPLSLVASRGCAAASMCRVFALAMSGSPCLSAVLQ